MPVPHTIRLIGPWSWMPISAELLQAEEVEGERRRFQAPMGLAEQLPADFRGALRLERSFNCPTGLKADDRVDLCCQLACAGQLRLNDWTHSFAAGEQRWSVRDKLRRHNRLAIALRVDTPDPGEELVAVKRMACDVWLEITAAATDET